MEQYIKKSALVAEIERRNNICQGVANANENNEFTHLYYCGKTEAYSEMSEFLDTIEVKEVDLEEEIELVKGDYEQVDVAWNNDFDFIARHFFKLGLKAKGE